MPRPLPPSTSSSSSHPTASPQTTKRLHHELQSYASSPSPALLALGPAGDDLLSWEAVMRGVEGGGYEAGRWKLAIQIPSTYPMAPPGIKFATRICHPNINFKTGEICLDLLSSSWTPAYTIAAALEAVHQLLSQPEVESPLNVDVAALLRSGDRVAAEALVRWCCGEWRWGGGEWGDKGGGRGE